MSFHNRKIHTHSQMPATSAEIERLLFHMPAVAQWAENDWSAGFARSVIGQCKRRGWKPSPKQLSMMRKLVADLFLYPNNEQEGGDFELIE